MQPIHSLASFRRSWVFSKGQPVRINSALSTFSSTSASLLRTAVYPTSFVAPSRIRVRSDSAIHSQSAGLPLSVFRGKQYSFLQYGSIERIAADSFLGQAPRRYRD